MDLPAVVHRRCAARRVGLVFGRESCAVAGEIETRVERAQAEALFDAFERVGFAALAEQREREEVEFWFDAPTTAIALTAGGQTWKARYYAFSGQDPSAQRLWLLADAVDQMAGMARWTGAASR